MAISAAWNSRQQQQRGIVGDGSNVQVVAAASATSGMRHLQCETDEIESA